MTATATARESVTFEVSDSVPFPGPTTIAAWQFRPPESTPPRALLLAIPGGTYAKDYWHVAIDGHPGYSFAEYVAAQGYLVVAVDNLGTGESTRPPDGDAVGLAEMSGANAAVVRTLRSRLPTLPVVGVGHSMGGCLAVRQQAEHRSFDAVAVLGYGYQPLAGLSGGGSDAELLAETAARFAAMPAACADGYYDMDRGLLRSSFYADDVPPEVVAADEQVATVLPRAALHRVAATPLGRDTAAAVDVPLFQAWGENDNTPDPHRDAQYFPSCVDYSLYVLGGAAHCHNFASRRHDLWRRLCLWMPTVLSR